MSSSWRATEVRIARALHARRTIHRRAGFADLESMRLVAQVRQRQRPPSYILADLRRASAHAGPDRLALAVLHLPATDETIVAMSLADARRLLVAATRPHAPRGESACVACGCTDSRACPDGCTWTWMDRARCIGLCSTHVHQP